MELFALGAITLILNISMATGVFLVIIKYTDSDG